MTHLILHKVRGQSAFDIAEQIQIGDEDGWIIPTSGHRAYPYRTIPLNSIIADDLFDMTIPDDWPDHYHIHKAPIEQKIDTGKLFGAIMNTIVGKFPRRA